MTAINTILFDLDGTLIDTAPDLGFALNELRKEAGKEPLPIEEIAPVISDGVRGLLKYGFNLEPTDEQFNPMREKFLKIYRDHIADSSEYFPGLKETIDWITAQKLKWGIVTNKPRGLTIALLSELKIAVPCVICGDDLPVTKPDPAPMFLACQKLSTTPEQSVYIGDAPRDIEAGINANMTTVYIGHGPLYNVNNAKGSDYQINSGTELLQLLQTLTKTSPESKLRKIRWHCRRGMLELDMFFLPFFDNHYQSLSAAEQADFVKLLDCNDQELFTWMMGRTTPPKEHSKIVNEIRKHTQLED